MEEQAEYNIIEEQLNLDSELKRGIIYTIYWIAGIGSYRALKIGIKSMKLIKKSNGKLKGKIRSLWCIILGSAGLMFWIPIFIIVVIKTFI